MKYDKKSQERKSNFPGPVLKFCCEKVLSLLCDKTNGVRGFTGHNRQDLFNSGNNYLFQCHPLYRTGSNSQFQSTVWYDLAIFDLEDDGAVPCQILCFVHLFDLKVPYESATGFVIDSPGMYAIVRQFEESPIICGKSKFMKQRRVDNQLYLFSTDNIVCEAAVVPNLTKDDSLNRYFFLVSKRDVRLEQFRYTWQVVKNPLVTALQHL